MANEQDQGSQETGSALMRLSQPRLPYHPAFNDRFGVDIQGWRVLCESVFPNAQTVEGVLLALSYCRHRKLDVMKRPVHVVPIWDNTKRRIVETVWPGIGEHRITAERTGKYAGMDACVFGPDVTRTFKDRTKKGDGWEDKEVTLTYPEWAQITVYKLVGPRSDRVPVPGPRTRWNEYYSRRGRTSLPNDRWERAPEQMLEKCAEAAALRRAFPEEIGETPTMEESGSYFRGGDDAKDVTPQARQPERTRGPSTAAGETTSRRTGGAGGDGAAPAATEQAASGQGAQQRQPVAGEGAAAKTGNGGGAKPAAEAAPKKADTAPAAEAKASPPATGQRAQPEEPDMPEFLDRNRKPTTQGGTVAEAAKPLSAEAIIAGFDACGSVAELQEYWPDVEAAQAHYTAPQWAGIREAYMNREAALFDAIEEAGSR